MNHNGAMTSLQWRHNGCNRVNSPHKWPVTRKMFPFDDVIMYICVGNLSQHCFRQWPRLAPVRYRGNDAGIMLNHDDVIKWKHFPHYWPFVRGIHRSPVNSPNKGQWRGALDVFFDLSKQSWGWWFETPSDSLWRHCNVCEPGCKWWHREAGDLRRHRTHYDVIVMYVSLDVNDDTVRLVIWDAIGLIMTSL